MKPFLGIDLTANKKNEQFHGEEFLVLKPSAALSSSLESSTEKAEETVARAKLPLPFRIIQYVCGLAALLLVSGILRGEVSFAEGYRNAPWIYWGAGICAVIWLILWLWSRQKSNAVLSTEESTQTLSHLESVSDSIYTELSVPGDAKEVDILSFFYKVKDGKIKVCEKGLQIAQYLNPVFKIFSNSENLYLSNLEGKYAFPLSSITSIHTVKKHIRMIGWNKEEALNKGIYKQYKLTADDYGCVHCKYYHILEINHQGDVYGIYFPCYELPVFEKLTGLKAQQEA
ncbi:MAG: hypothetical protein IJY91_01700 [Oscillospiraceae bacterium]|nr:hypothetical protein [Oscillospiraceae bacterium]